MSRGRTRPGLGRLLLRATGLLLAVLAALLCWSVVRVASIDVGALANTRPRETALMKQRAREAARSGRTSSVRWRWMSGQRISPHLRHAVLVAEDDAFFSHGGLDWDEIEASAQRNWRAGRIVRGGSTITQQLAKNLWLSDSRTPTRKFEELLLALRLERTLSKRRIFELYLNCIEWGDGVYGADAAARHWFGVSASDLSPRQAVALAAVIINPRRHSPVAPSRRIERRIRMIERRLARRGQLPAPVPRPTERPPASAPADSVMTPVPPAPEPPDSAVDAQAPSASLTRRETTAPSTLPFTCGMSAAITLPISFAVLAPVSATARVTSSRTASSESASGR